MNLSVYPWQTGLRDSLCRLAEAGRLPHALLLAAAEGTGKQQFARAFAAWRLCQQPVAGEACGRCRSCDLIAAGTHPDLHWVSPERVDDKVSKVITVAQTRQLVDFATQAAQRQGWRVIVISPADALNTAAANGLLKTLEEPGRDTLFLLLTDQPTGLLATIRSRCQLLPLSVPDAEAAMTWLRGQLPNPAEASTLLTLARGAPVAAAALRESPWYAARADLLDDLVAVARRTLMPLQAATRWNKLDAIAQVTAWQSLLDDAVQCGLVPDHEPLHADLAQPLRHLAETSADVLLETLWQAVETRRLLDTTVQAQSLLESLWLHWGRESRKKPA